MKTLRVRTADPVDGKLERHTFIEVRPDFWVEVAEEVAGAEFISIEPGVFDNIVGFSGRAFDIGIIKNWREENPVTVV